MFAGAVGTMVTDMALSSGAAFSVRGATARTAGTAVGAARAAIRVDRRMEGAAPRAATTANENPADRWWPTANGSGEAQVRLLLLRSSCALTSASVAAPGPEIFVN